MAIDVDDANRRQDLFLRWWDAEDGRLAGVTFKQWSSPEAIEKRVARDREIVDAWLRERRE